MGISLESLRLVFRNKVLLPAMRHKRMKRLHEMDFTIISNNCWAGTVYESYGMQKLSPTVGMFIMPADYLKLISRLDDYLQEKLVFIQPAESKWRSELEHKRDWGTYIIGRLNDIELHMLHYHDEETARMKWQSRVKRIHRDRLIFKFNDQNGCMPEHIREFMALPLQNKICFVASKKMQVNHGVILVRQPFWYKDGIKASREPFGRTKYIDITAYINRLAEKGI